MGQSNNKKKGGDKEEQRKKCPNDAVEPTNCAECEPLKRVLHACGWTSICRDFGFNNNQCLTCPAEPTSCEECAAISPVRLIKACKFKSACKAFPNFIKGE